ncbi:hypothetical protein CTEN210_03269 [Chaetoceros tenuissimus]|uniref:HhH-GPD domain-containing protein n=1 Tax=Chaetoceros tenuissimus TaxID=426638 RepID=A0AAD3CKJ4_9STRA|nr:hypothetical protein CTEN210_03269 [Chaetoceros tenuissimus]
MAKSRSRIENDDCSSSPNYLTSMRGDDDQLLSHLFKGINSTSTITRSGWCLKDGTYHLLQACNGIFRPIVEAQGVETTFMSSEVEIHAEKEVTCFQSLCRAITGQGTSNSTAKIYWTRLTDLVGNDFCPENFADREDYEIYLQKEIGFSRAKARYIIGLSEAFVNGTLSELMLKTGSEKDIRDALLPISGIGDWTIDMFLIFHLQLPDVLPLGDLNVKKGIADLFSLRGKEKKEKMNDIMKPFAPYRSLAALYFWKVADSKPSSRKKKATKKLNSSPKKNNTMNCPENKRKGNIAKCSGSMDTPVAKRTKRLRRKVTP